MTPEQELEETYRQIARLIEETEQRLERMRECRRTLALAMAARVAAEKSLRGAA